VYAEAIGSEERHASMSSMHGWTSVDMIEPWLTHVVDKRDRTSLLPSFFASPALVEVQERGC
jgi:hypothetical protein